MSAAEKGTSDGDRSLAEVAVSAWAILGVLALLARAIIALTPRALEAVGSPDLGPLHLAVGAVWFLWMGYAEGYKGFQRSFSPRVVARALHLGRRREPLLHVVLAPLFAMGYFHATRRIEILAWGVTLAIVGLIVLVHFVPQPWRGVIDAGVVFGLVWGALSLVVLYVRGLASPRDAAGEAYLPG